METDLSSVLNRIESSMKYQDLTSLTADEIIAKYESWLDEREKQTAKLSYQFGVINEKYYSSIDRLKSLAEENKEMERKKKKKEEMLQREKNNLKIMMDKIEFYTKENEKLRKEVKDIEVNKEMDLDKEEEKDKKRGRSLNSKKKKNDSKGNSKLMSENLDYVPLFK